MRSRNLLDQTVSPKHFRTDARRGDDVVVHLQRLVSIKDLDVSLAEMIGISEILCAPAWHAMQEGAVNVKLADVDQSEADDSHVQVEAGPPNPEPQKAADRTSPT